MDVLLQSLLEGDKPLTLGILAYIVFLLHKSDGKQTKAIKWLKRTECTLINRVDNLEKFNQQVHPNEWREPPKMPTYPEDEESDLL